MAQGMIALVIKPDYPELSPSDSHNGSREPSPIIGSLSFICTLWQMHTHEKMYALRK